MLFCLFSVNGFVIRASAETTKNIASTIRENITLIKSRDQYKEETYQIQANQNDHIKIKDISKNNQNIYNLTYKKGSYCLSNLFPFHVYKISRFSSADELIEEYFIQPTNPRRFISTEYIINLRDLGGIKVNDGTNRYGILYRGAQIPDYFTNRSRLDEDLQIMQDLGIQVEIDIRNNEEVQSTKDIKAKYAMQDQSFIAGAEYLQIPVNAYSDAVEMDNYKHDRTVSALHAIIDSVNNGKVVYYHCAAGVDRTGTISFLLEGLLGADEQSLDEDYGLQLTTQTKIYDSQREYKKMKQYMFEYRGDNLQEKFFNWFIDSGFTEKELKQFQAIMIGGGNHPN